MRDLDTRTRSLSPKAQSQVLGRAGVVVGAALLVASMLGLVALRYLSVVWAKDDAIQARAVARGMYFGAQSIRRQAWIDGAAEVQRLRNQGASAEDIARHEADVRRYLAMFGAPPIEAAEPHTP